MLKRVLLVLCLLGLTNASARSAAQALPVEPGQRVRLTLSAQPHEVEGHALPQQLRGRILSVSGDSVVVVLHPALGPTSVALSAITAAELSRGVEPWWEGAWRQGKSSAVTFAIQWFFFDWVAKDSFFANPFEAAVVGAGVGMIGGGVWGALRPQELWSPLPWGEKQDAPSPFGARAGQ